MKKDKTNAMRILDKEKIEYSMMSYDPDDGKIDGVSVAEKIGREVRERLIEWWSKEYCAGRMTLAVVGKGESIVACIRRGNDRWRIMQNPSRS